MKKNKSIWTKINNISGIKAYIIVGIMLFSVVISLPLAILSIISNRATIAKIFVGCFIISIIITYFLWDDYRNNL